ncbi:protein ENHANCED DISEASE RESISTANCE 2-like isoform X3 [Apium graveolens]|uniref:protein ENHANCED DISEASE RESISTANCE 2-like isoform X3 n=1 Tax=Apium graveolens TaxID=4045 RepID=UPI003D7B838A
MTSSSPVKGSPESEAGGQFEYFGWVYHLGVNKIGHEFCRLRFLYIRGSRLFMYKRDPHEHPDIKPIRRGAIGHTLMVEESGRRKVNESIACATAGEARKWMEAFDHAKQQAEYELTRGRSTRNKLNKETEIDLDGHRRRVRHYAHGLKKLIRIGQGPETLLRQSSLNVNIQTAGNLEGDAGDVVEGHEWKCVRTVNGVRVFEDVAGFKDGKVVLVKAVGVVDASADTVFEVIFNIDRQWRYEWDVLTEDLELIDTLDGHYDIVYGTLDAAYQTSICNRWSSKSDFVFSRQWFRGQDGTYTILQFPAMHKKRPKKAGYRRIKINPSTWEMRILNTTAGNSKCLVTHMLEVHSKVWRGWKKNQRSKFEKTVPYALLSQVAGLKAYIGANPAFSNESSSMLLCSKNSDYSASDGEFVDAAEATDEFYDALSSDSSSSDEDSDKEVECDKKVRKMRLKNVSWAIAGFSRKRTADPFASKELDTSVDPIALDPTQYQGSMRQGKDGADGDCWTSPDGAGFKIRGKTYLKDNTKIAGGEPLLKLIAVDWFKDDGCINNIALHPSCLVQSEAGRKLPFVLVVNLQVPAKPNYSLVLYFAANRPINGSSLLGQFVDGTDLFRDSRFKLIPSIKEGYWMVKRAVGTKACLLGKAVTCKYLRQDNFLEIDVDIGSSSVARSIIGLVLGYVTSIVVDLAILIEGREENELPEYLLGTVRLNRVKPDSAVPFGI